MKNTGTYFLFTLLIALVESCEDVYKPGELRKVEKIPIIHGIIEEDKLPTVSLTWSLLFNEEKQQNITNARVYITENTIDTAFLEEITPGNYTSYDDKYKGVKGKTYILHVELSDGSKYISSPEYLNEKPIVDSLYAKIENRYVYQYDEHNNVITQRLHGLSIQADLSANSDSTLFYRFDTHFIKQMSYTINLYSPQEYTIYLWERNQLDDIYASNFTVSKDNKQVLRGHDVGYLSYYYDQTHESKSVSGTFIDSWDITFKVYSISRDVFNYYNSVGKQLDAKDEVFAPMPAMIYSNLKCVNDPEKMVVGVFEVVSNTIVTKAFGWKTIYEYNSKNLSSFPDDLSNGESPKFQPYWWVYF